ncbi:MAG: MFS transporter [Rhodobacterales bacterium]|nr:MFS transporter [Rhodobacterales bacterium]
MIKVLGSSWALLLGVMLLMVGNGMQGSLLGIRGGIEGFSTTQMSWVMSAYFLGFLFGSRMTPLIIRRVGHVRVFAALGTMISAVLVMYPVLTDVWAWAVLRVMIGFCFSGVYITAESWLNNAASNETRGQAMSAYMIVQMLGIVAGQGLLNVADPGGVLLFILPSVLVSLAFTPMLLAATPTPVFESITPLSFRQLFRISPLGCLGMLTTGGMYSAMFGMAAVWGTAQGLSVGQISVFVAAMYVGGLVFQYPVGWLSDRTDRRRLILWLSIAGAVLMGATFAVELPFALLVVSSLILGGVTNPLYALLIAYTHDFLRKEDMASASAGLIFLNGGGAIFGPVVTGWMMGVLGPQAFFLFIGLMFAGLSVYAAWRMTRRASPAPGASFAPVLPSASVVAVEAVRDRPAAS